MSLHFSDTTPDNQRDLLAALVENPLDPVLLTAIGDAAEEQGNLAHARLLRENHHLAMLAVLRGKSLNEEQCAQVLAANTADRAAMISRLLGTPETTILPDLRTPEGVRAQVDFQRLLLASLDLLTEQNGHPGVTGIDGKFHPMPSADAIAARLASPELQRKMEQGFDQLLLVPFALPLERHIEAWKQHLLRNEHLLAAQGGLDRKRPVWSRKEGYGLHNGRGPDEDGRLVYFPQRFGWIHRGRTKQQILTAHPSAGWQILLTEGALHEIPRRGQGQTLAGRPQIEAGRTPREYLASLPAGETGWSPETYMAAARTHLERSGRTLDANSYTYLVGSCLPGLGDVPYGFWFQRIGRMRLDGFHAGNADIDGGIRTAVRVI